MPQHNDDLIVPLKKRKIVYSSISNLIDHGDNTSTNDSKNNTQNIDDHGDNTSTNDSNKNTQNIDAHGDITSKNDNKMNIQNKDDHGDNISTKNSNKNIQSKDDHGDTFKNDNKTNIQNKNDHVDKTSKNDNKINIQRKDDHVDNISKNDNKKKIQKDDDHTANTSTKNKRNIQKNYSSVNISTNDNKHNIQKKNTSVNTSSSDNKLNIEEINNNANTNGSKTGIKKYDSIDSASASNDRGTDDQTYNSHDNNKDAKPNSIFKDKNIKDTKNKNVNTKRKSSIDSGVTTLGINITESISNNTLSQKTKIASATAARKSNTVAPAQNRPKTFKSIENAVSTATPREIFDINVRNAFDSKNGDHVTLQPSEQAPSRQVPHSIYDSYIIKNQTPKKIKLSEHLLRPPWPFDFPRDPRMIRQHLTEIAERNHAYKIYVNHLQINKKRKITESVDLRCVKKQNTNSKNTYVAQNSSYKIEANGKQSSPSEPRKKKKKSAPIIKEKYTDQEYRDVLNQLLEKNIVEPGDGALFFKYEDNIVSCALLNDGLLWFMDEMFNSIPQWMDYVTKPIKLLYHNDTDRLKRVFFKTHSLHAWLQYSNALSTLNSSRKRRKLTPLQYDLKNPHFKDNIKSNGEQSDQIGSSQSVYSDFSNNTRNISVTNKKQKKSPLKMKQSTGKNKNTVDKVDILPIVVKRRRGRPRKIPIVDTAATVDKSPKQKKGKGKVHRNNTEAVKVKDDKRNPYEENYVDEGPVTTSILSPHWEQKFIEKKENRSNFLQISDLSDSIWTNLSTATSINFKATKVLSTEGNKVQYLINKTEYETIKAYNLIVDRIIKSEEYRKNGNSNNNNLKSGYHFLSNAVLPDKMKPEKLDKMTKTLSTPTIDPLIMVPCQNYEGNNNNKSWRRRVTSTSTRKSRTTINSSLLSEKQPFKVIVLPEALLLGDIHAHLCTDEVIGLLGGCWDAEKKLLVVDTVLPCRELKLPPPFDQSVSVEMDPSSASEATNVIQQCGKTVVGWYHSHPIFQPSPSICDINNQTNYQNMFKDNGIGNDAVVPPYVGMIFTPFDNFSARNNKSRVNIFHTRPVETNADRRTRRVVHIPMRLNATPLKYTPVSVPIQAGCLSWETSTPEDLSTSDNNGNGQISEDNTDGNMGIIKDIMNSLLLNVELSWARDTFISRVQTPNSHTASSNKSITEDNNPFDDKQMLVIKTFIKKYNICIEPIICQIIQLVSYYKHHKNKTKFKNKLFTSLKKDKLLASVLSHSKRLQIQNDALKQEFAHDVVKYILEQMKKEKIPKSNPNVLKKKQKKQIIDHKESMKVKTNGYKATIKENAKKKKQIGQKKANINTTNGKIIEGSKGRKKKRLKMEVSDWDFYENNIVQFLKYYVGRKWYESRQYGVRKKILLFLKKNIEELSRLNIDVIRNGTTMTAKMTKLKAYMCEVEAKENKFRKIITENFPLKNIKKLIAELETSGWK
jgi:proteasome lid subunit RPN8/RPN11